MATATFFQRIDVSALSLDLVAKKSKHGNLIFVKNESRSLMFQTPPLPIAWNVNVRSSDYGNYNCVLPMNLNGEKGLAFKMWLQAVGDHIKELVRRHGESILGSKVSVQHLDRMSLIKLPPASATANNLATTFLPKLAFDKETLDIETGVFDMSGNTLRAEDVAQGRRPERILEVLAIVLIDYVFVGTNGTVSMEFDMSVV
ncbi:hypothetical protein JKP88DRAFT_289828 [Tribonema minus]|uniref:Uncharacterized protein n=1 Tax=Tribonema minus TaxID=303371 RepID=A0A835Z754_9STRA|nr:hypothetical protein JKP88DRAFT_289828 [Tribonema minus]